MAKILILSALFIVLFTCISFADMIIDVEVNSYKLAFDPPPFIGNGSVYVPLRAISDALGIYCEWDKLERCAYTSSQNGEAIFCPDSSSVYDDNGFKSLRMYIVDGRLMVPVRYLADIHGFEISWDQAFYRVLIESDGDVDKSLTDTTYNQDEVYWLSKIIYAEAGGESIEGQLAVGNVVLNRVKSSEFPNTIYTVIFDRAGGIQFEPVINGSIYLPPSYSAVEAAKRALSGESTVGESLFFLNPQKAQSFWIVDNREFFCTIGNHDFYL